MYRDVHLLLCLRVLFIQRLVSGTTIFKRLTDSFFNGASYAKPPRMAVVLISSVFALQTRR